MKRMSDIEFTPQQKFLSHKLSFWVFVILANVVTTSAMAWVFGIAAAIKFAQAVALVYPYAKGEEEARDNG